MGLIRFCCLSFILIFLIFGALQFLHFRIDSVRLLPVREQSLLRGIISAAQRALPAALYLTLLLGLSYTARKGIPFLPSTFCLLVLSLGFTLVLSEGIVLLKNIPAPEHTKTPEPLGGPGLIFSQGDTSIVLLEEPGNIRGPRVVSLAGRPLAYQERPLGPDNTIPPLPPIPFRYATTAQIYNIGIDFSLTARQFEARRDAGFIPFLIYCFSLIFLLVSFRFVLDLSNWPLANLFLGILIFRGVLAGETFLNDRDIQAFLDSFLRNYLDVSFITPLIFCSLGLLVLFYTLLTRTAKNRRPNED
jgi:hypothetical protein